VRSSWGRRGNRRQHVGGRKVAARSRWVTSGQEHQPVSLCPDAGPDDNERSWATTSATGAWRCSGTTELTGIRQESGHVAANAQAADGSTREVQAAYVAGCDGGHSAVRELCASPFPARRTSTCSSSRYRGDGPHGRGRAERIPVARGFSTCSSRLRARIAGG